jgi:serine/threonine protein kinase
MNRIPLNEFETLKVDYSLNSLYDELDISPTDPMEDSSQLDSLNKCQNRYENKKWLANGGMKTVSKLFDTHTNRYIAIAEMLENTPDELAESFIREARINALMDHPNIITIFDIGINKQHRPYFTMALKEGDSLAKILHKRQEKNKYYLDNFPLESLLQIYLKICDAIAYAHSLNIIHLDLKPENIQIGQFGEVWVCDWGLAKILSQSEEQNFDNLLLNPDLLNNFTLHGTIKGTPGYMSPEQISNEDKTKKSDVYAMGALLYSLITDHQPLEGDVDSVLKQTIQGNICPPRTRFPSHNISTVLEAITSKAMELEPKERYDSVQEIRQEVQCFINGYSTLVEEASFLRQLKLLYKRNKTISNILLGSLLLISVLVMLFIQQLQQRNQAISAAKTDAEQALSQYKKEKSWTDEYIENNSSKYLASVLFPEPHKNSKNPVKSLRISIEYLDRLIQLKPNEKKSYFARGIIYFIMQNYNQAYKDLALYPIPTPHILQLAQTYMNTGERDISTEEFDQMIQKLVKFDSLSQRIAERALIFHASKHETAVIARSIRKILMQLNPKWQNKTFLYNHNLRSLKLSGKGLSNTNLSHKSLLDILKIKHLDLQHMRNVTPNILRLLDISSLDIRHSDINEEWMTSFFLKKMKVICSVGQLRNIQHNDRKIVFEIKER